MIGAEKRFVVKGFMAATLRPARETRGTSGQRSSRSPSARMKERSSSYSIWSAVGATMATNPEAIRRSPDGPGSHWSQSNDAQIRADLLKPELRNLLGRKLGRPCLHVDAPAMHLGHQLARQIVGTLEAIAAPGS